MKGASEMIAKLNRVAQRYPDHVGSGLYVEASIDMTESKKRCPVDTRPNAPHPGQLRASGRVDEPVRKFRTISVMLSYGGPAIEYAVYVHEDPDAFHPVGQWKYLESVLVESEPHMAARVARRIHLDKWRP